MVANTKLYMYNKFSKKGEFYMKENILIILAILILTALCVQITNQNGKNRYDVVTSSNMLTILVDKKTGVTWRNCVCGEKSNVPGCWERMYTINPDMYSKPIGEVHINKKLQALIDKQKKEETKTAPAAQPQQQTENTKTK